MIKFEFTYNLLKPVTINQNQEINSLTFKAPTMAQKQDAAKIKQFVMTAFEKRQNNQDKSKTIDNDERKSNDNESKDDQGYSLGSALYSVESADMISILSTFENIVTTKNSCIMNNSQPLNTTIFKEFLMADVDRMFGAYVTNFIIASL